MGFVYTMPTETYPIWTMLSRRRRGAASPRYRNRATITVFMCQQKPFPVRFSCPRKSCDPYDSVSIDLVTESVGTTNLQASFLPLVNEAGGQQIVTCIVFSLFLNDMVTIFYLQIYHSSTICSTEINQLANETHAGNQVAFNYIYCSFTF